MGETMRLMLAILISAALMLSGAAIPLHAQPAHAARHAGGASALQAHPHQHHASGQACHEAPEKAPADDHGCCDTKGKCASQSCPCFTCFGAFLTVRPAKYAAALAPLQRAPDLSAKPPEARKKPPAPPPQA
jgi:hypothetical protein